jgi:hypothetical protein
MSNGRRIQALGGTIVRCYEEPRCIEEFRSASDPNVIAAQLKAAGWQVLRTQQGTIYRCPLHSRFLTSMPPTGGEGRFSR